MARGGRQNTYAALVKRVIEAGVDDTRDLEGVDQFGVGGFDDDWPEEEVGGLEAGSSDDDRRHWENLLRLQSGCKPNGDHAHDRHNCITRWPYFYPLQSLSLIHISEPTRLGMIS